LFILVGKVDESAALAREELGLLPESVAKQIGDGRYAYENIERHAHISFLLGDSLFALRKFDEAVKTFQTLYPILEMMYGISEADVVRCRNSLESSLTSLGQTEEVMAFRAALEQRREAVKATCDGIGREVTELLPVEDRTEICDVDGGGMHPGMQGYVQVVAEIIKGYLYMDDLQRQAALTRLENFADSTHKATPHRDITETAKSLASQLAAILSRVEKGPDAVQAGLQFLYRRRNVTLSQLFGARDAMLVPERDGSGEEDNESDNFYDDDLFDSRLSPSSSSSAVPIVNLPSGLVHPVSRPVRDHDDKPDTTIITVDGSVKVGHTSPGSLSSSSSRKAPPIHLSLQNSGSQSSQTSSGGVSSTSTGHGQRLVHTLELPEHRKMWNPKKKRISLDQELTKRQSDGVVDSNEETLSSVHITGGSLQFIPPKERGIPMGYDRRLRLMNTLRVLQTFIEAGSLIQSSSRMVEESSVIASNDSPTISQNETLDVMTVSTSDAIFTSQLPEPRAAIETQSQSSSTNFLTFYLTPVFIFVALLTFIIRYRARSTTPPAQPVEPLTDSSLGKKSTVSTESNVTNVKSLKSTGKSGKKGKGESFKTSYSPLSSTSMSSEAALQDNSPKEAASQAVQESDLLNQQSHSLSAPISSVENSETIVAEIPANLTPNDKSSVRRSPLLHSELTESNATHQHKDAPFQKEAKSSSSSETKSLKKIEKKDVDPVPTLLTSVTPSPEIDLQEEQVRSPPYAQSGVELSSSSSSPSSSTPSEPVPVKSTTVTSVPLPLSVDTQSDNDRNRGKKKQKQKKTDKPASVSPMLEETIPAKATEKPEEVVKETVQQQNSATSLPSVEEPALSQPSPVTTDEPSVIVPSGQAAIPVVINPALAPEQHQAQPPLTYEQFVYMQQYYQHHQMQQFHMQQQQQQQQQQQMHLQMQHQQLQQQQIQIQPQSLQPTEMDSQQQQQPPQQAQPPPPPQQQLQQGQAPLDVPATVLPPGISLQQWQNDQNAMNFAMQAMWQQQQQQQQFMAQNPQFMMQPGMMASPPFNQMAFQMMQQQQFRLQQQQQQQQFNNQQRRFPPGNGYVFRGGSVRGGRGGGHMYSNNAGPPSSSFPSPSRQSARFARRHPSKDHTTDDVTTGSSVDGEGEGSAAVASHVATSRSEAAQEEEQKDEPKDGDIMIFNRNVYLMTIGDQGNGFYLQGPCIPDFASHEGLLKVDSATRETILMSAKNSK